MMIRVAVLYPNSSDSHFDVDYYKTRHMALVREKLGPLGLQGCEVDTGIASLDGGPAPYAAIGYIFFESLEAFQAGFAQVGDKLVADVPNYTNIHPSIQISDHEKL